MPNLVESLLKYTTIVQDTGDIAAIAEFKPQDATTNPSLIFKAAQMPAYEKHLEDALEFGRQSGGSEVDQAAAFLDKLFVNFGVEILQHVPGRVSTEVDAHLSFDTEATIAKARRLIGLYNDKSGIDQDGKYLGRDSSSRAVREGRNPLQPDVAV